MEIGAKLSLDSAKGVDSQKPSDKGACRDCDEFSGVIKQVDSDIRNQQEQSSVRDDKKTPAVAESGNSDHERGNKLPSDSANEMEASENGSNLESEVNSAKTVDSEAGDNSGSLNSEIRQEMSEESDLIDHLFNSAESVALAEADSEAADYVATQNGGAELGLLNAEDLDGDQGLSVRLTNLEYGIDPLSEQTNATGNLRNLDSTIVSLNNATAGAANDVLTMPTGLNSSYSGINILQTGQKSVGTSDKSQNLTMNAGAGEQALATGSVKSKEFVVQTNRGLFATEISTENGEPALDANDLVQTVSGKLGKDLPQSISALNSISQSLNGLVAPSNVSGTGNTVQPLGLNLASTSTQSNISSYQTLETPFSGQNWSEDFAVRMRSLVTGNVQQASLNLRPAELGSIDVMLSTDGNDTKVQFMVQNAAVKDAVEASLPRLKEIFEQAGMSLSDTDVQDQSAQGHTNHDNSADPENFTALNGKAVAELQGEPEDTDEWRSVSPDSLSLGTVDYFI